MKKTATTDERFAPYRDRLRRLRKAVADAECDALLITNPVDIHYLSPFPGEDSYALVAPRRFVILSDFRFEEELASVKGLATVHMRDGGIDAAAGALLADMGLQRVALQAEQLTIASRQRIAKAAGGAALKPTKALLSDLRAIKDDSEIALVRRAIKLQEEAFTRTLETIEPRQSEQAICAELEYNMKRLGSERPAFHTIVAARANGALPHARPGNAKTAARRPLLIDWGAVASGYHGDLTRTLTLGAWPKPLGHVYDVVLEALETGIGAIAPGARCKDVDAAARAVIEKAGYGDRFGHGLGHGLGLDVHEAPRLSKHSGETLAAGMVVTVEPGVYLPGIGGVRIEEDILVTKTGSRTLSSLPRDKKWAVR